MNSYGTDFEETYDAVKYLLDRDFSLIRLHLKKNMKKKKLIKKLDNLIDIKD